MHLSMRMRMRLAMAYACRPSACFSPSTLCPTAASRLPKSHWLGDIIDRITAHLSCLVSKLCFSSAAYSLPTVPVVLVVASNFLICPICTAPLVPACVVCSQLGFGQVDLDWTGLDRNQDTFEVSLHWLLHLHLRLHLHLHLPLSGTAPSLIPPNSIHQPHDKDLWALLQQPI